MQKTIVMVLLLLSLPSPSLVPHPLVQKLTGKCDSYHCPAIHLEMHLQNVLKDIVIGAQTYLTFVKTWSGQVYL